MIGSYLNVLIYRLPRELDTVSSRSSCPKCYKKIFWYENIPIVSYIFLKGRCSGCKSLISFKYPLVEILLGIVAINLFPARIDLTNLYFFAFYLSVASVFIVHFCIDIEFKLLPDKLNLYLAIVFFAHTLIFINMSWSHWLMGAIIGFGFPYAVTWGFYKYSGKVGMGGGDIKLFGALGLLLGPTGVMLTIFLSCFLGALSTLGLIASKLIKRDDPIPFGPFILIIASVQIFFPNLFNEAVRWLGISTF